MRSHAILRTNVGLTTNAKIMVNGSYSLFIDAIISTPDLSSTKFKKKEFNKDNYWDELVPYFFKGVPAETAFSVKDDDDNKNMSKDFSNQYDDIYQYGARNIIENKDYTEEFEYFAPLFVSKISLPKNFVIFRIDGPGLNKIDKNNFKSEIINKLKFVKNFDLTRNSPLGEWLERNITKNKSFPQTSLFIDFRNLEFSSWNGIDYEDGGYSEKSILMDSILGKEQTYQDLEKFILDGYKNNKVVFPYIYNFSFLFDDTPATPTSIRTWSINRYLGFYLDELELVKYVSPYNLPKIKSDVVIDANNVIFSPSSLNPFVDSFIVEENPYIEIGGNFYKIEKYLEQQPLTVTRVQNGRNSFNDVPESKFITKYKIISNIILQGRQSEINKNLIFIDSNNKLTYSNGTTFEIEGFDNADVWMIQIDGIYHNIVKKVDGEFYLNTDYAFSQSLEKVDYYINDPDPNFRKTISLKVNSNTAPKQFGIFRCKFTDIKDFDLDIVDTEYSKFEYMFTNKLTNTDETKMYSINQSSTTSPKDLDDFKINGDVVNIPASSEYTANNSEIFRIENNDLNILWKKNSKRIKWGFQNSLSSNDYPYLLNNSFSSEDFNRTVNPYNPLPIREDRNLDYFLTINADSNLYSHQSLHINSDNTTTFTDIDDGDSTNFVRLLNVSDVANFSENDFIKIISDDLSFDMSTKVKSVDFLSKSIITELDYSTTISATFSGTVQNLTRTVFSLDKYLNIGYQLDYFNYFFSKKTVFDSGKIVKNTKKYSKFNVGDKSIPNITLFRGLKFKIWDVSGVRVRDSVIESINVRSNNNFNDYKFSVLLSKNNFSINSDTNITNGAKVDFTQNLMRWQIIDEWKHDKIYQTGDLAKWNESIYQCLTQSQILDPKIYPFNSTDWNIWNNNNIFWNPIKNGTGTSSTVNNMLDLGQVIYNDFNVILPPLVYNSGQYYYSNGQTGNTFWNPGITYSLDDVVIYRGNLWKSRVNNNRLTPTSTVYQNTNGVYTEYWSKTTSENSIWTEVEIWSSQKNYLTSDSNWSSIFTKGHYVIYEDVVYVTQTDILDTLIPPLNPNWKRVYSLSQDTNFEYYSSFDDNYNPIIEMNNRLYFCRDNGVVQTVGTVSTLESLSTLENGINIFINKKWKNVLINIYINDNTFAKTGDLNGDGLNIYVEKDNISNTKRDDLYSDIYRKLSANNFMNAINDLSNNYDFSDKIRYIIINEDSSINLYDFNDLNTVANLPVLLTCEGPDEFLVKINSLIVKPETLSLSQIKPKRMLINGDINSLDQLNYYSDNSLGVSIEENKSDLFKVSNYSSLKNNLYNNLFRHSGYYSPIFHDIELFKRQTLTASGGNYQFDTELTYFGQIKERIVSKINRDKNILKLNNNPDSLSIYPMLDEFGYHTISFFIFKSTWDFEYHIECQEIPQTNRILGNQSLQFGEPSNNTNNINLNQL